MNLNPRSFSSWSGLKHHRDALRRQLELKAALIAIVVGVIGFLFVQYQIHEFAYGQFSNFRVNPRPLGRGYKRVIL